MLRVATVSASLLARIEAHSQIVLAEMYLSCAENDKEECDINVNSQVSKGSATRIKWNDHYYWLTAGHVCEIKKENIQINNMIINKVFVANVGHSGEIEELSKVVFANQYDLCLIKAKKGKIRKFANTTPNNGDNVHSFAYPGGAFGKDVYPLYKGTWNGKIENKCLTTIPVVGGSSGSSVLNNKDEIVSVIVSTMQNFNHFTLSVCLDDIKDFIQKADAILQQEE